MVKIQALRDRSGRVIATFEKPTGHSPAVTPVLEEGHTVTEMEVADDYEKDILSFYRQHG